MKLITRTNINYLIFSVVTYLGIVTAFFYVVEYLIYDEVEKRLLVEKKDFQSFVKKNGMWNDKCYFVQDKIEMAQVLEATNNDSFKDTVLVNSYTGENVPFRQITFYAVIDSVPYKIKIRKSLLESNKLIKYVMGTVLIFLSVALTIMFFFQRRISRRLWSPFYKTLHQAKAFEVSKNELPEFDHLPIYEFNELNEVLNKMTAKIHNDYMELKEFTENASHEIQTPLALINARIEELIQSENLSENQMHWIQEIYNSSLKVSKLHQALLLLSKINNNQFGSSADVHLNEYIPKKLDELQELLEAKNVKAIIRQEGICVFRMNVLLAEILFSNLIGNSVKHNVKDGMVTITLRHDQFLISNTGRPLSDDPEKLFERFRKDKPESDSLGLGLSIVKRICDLYGLRITYTFATGMHTISVQK